MSRLLIFVGFFFAFHSAYAVSKIRNQIYGEHNNVDFMKFPIEILIEIILSFILVTIGTISHYCSFEDIYTDKLNVEKRMKFVPKLTNSHYISKGNMINYFNKDYAPKVRI